MKKWDTDFVGEELGFRVVGRCFVLIRRFAEGGNSILLKLAIVFAKQLQTFVYDTGALSHCRFASSARIYCNRSNLTIASLCHISTIPSNTLIQLPVIETAVSV